MQKLRVVDLTADAIGDLDHLYRTTRDVRLRMRVQIVLLAAEKGLIAAEIATIVRTDEQTVRRWLKRYLTDGLDGLADAPRPGGPRKVTDTYRDQLLETARQQPAALKLPYAQWTIKRLADYMTQKTGVAVHPETIRQHLKAAGVALRTDDGPTAASHPGGPRALKHR